MNNIRFLNSVLAFSLLVPITNNIHAEIFKWTDERGVVKYSSTPPNNNFTITTVDEKVNSLQSKDLCIVEPVKKVTSANTAPVAQSNQAVENKNSATTVAVNKVATPVATQAKSILPTPTIATSFNAFTTHITTYIAQTKARIALLVANIRKTLAILFRQNPLPSPVVAPPVVVPPPVIPPIVVPPVVTPLEIVWSKCSDENQICRFTGTKNVRFGVEGKYVTKVFKDDILCTTSVFTDPAFGIFKACDVSNEITTETPAVETWENPVELPPVIPPVVVPPVVVPTSFLPVVDIKQNMTPLLGWDDLRIRPNLGPQDIPKVGDGNGQFRIDCEASHMGNDDPIVYPNQQGAAHHHTFFGNTSLNYKSDLSNLVNVGNSTCRGGIANRSAYWVPSMIDTSINAAKKPTSAIWYYKTGYRVAREKITAPPKGLRMIAGNMRSSSSQRVNPWTNPITYTCFLKTGGSYNGDSIPDCPQGATLTAHVSFPQCWDGKNLDSPDHISHISHDVVNSSCAAHHPIAIPKIDLNIHYLVNSPEGTKNWRLSSDNYLTNGYNAGYSGHADFVNGWDQKVIEGVVKNCLNAGFDCGNHMLNDGTVIYGLNRNF